jgi:hypothetical protein
MVMSVIHYGSMYWTHLCQSNGNVPLNGFLLNDEISTFSLKLVYVKY